MEVRNREKRFSFSFSFLPPLLLTYQFLRFLWKRRRYFLSHSLSNFLFFLGVIGHRLIPRPMSDYVWTMGTDKLISMTMSPDWDLTSHDCSVGIKYKESSDELIPLILLTDFKRRNMFFRRIYQRRPMNKVSSYSIPNKIKQEQTKTKI